MSHTLLPSSHRLRAFSFLLALLVAFQASAEPNFPDGAPIAEKYLSREFNAQAQGTQVVFDKRGIMYLANSQGLLEFDGNEWIKVDPEVIKKSYSVGVGPDGKVYVGRFEDFGYLEPDEKGSSRYISLRSEVPEEFLSDQIFLGLCSRGRDLIAYTASSVYIWNVDTKTMRTARGLANNSSVFTLGDEIFITGNAFALRKLEGDRFVDLDNREAVEFFKGENGQIREVAKDLKSDIAYLITAYSGVYRFDGSDLEKMDLRSDFESKWRHVESAEVLENGHLAIGTSREGIYLFEPDGDMVGRYTKKDGLTDNRVIDLAEDGQNGLWLVQDKGLARMQIPSPISLYTESNGLDGVTRAIIEYQGALYVGTDTGLFVLNKTMREDRSFQFESVEEASEALSFIETRHGLLVGGIERLQLLNESGLQELKIGWDQGSIDSTYMTRLSGQPDILVVGGYPGVHLIRETDDGFIREPLDNEYARLPAHGFAEDPSGDVWIKAGDGVTRRIVQDNASWRIEAFDTKDGLLGGWISPLNVGGKVLFTTSQGKLQVFDETERVFKVDSRYQYFPGELPHGFIEIVRDEKGKDWVSSSVGNGKLILRPEGDYVVGMQYLSDMPDVRANAVWEGASGNLWLGIHDGVVKYNASDSLGVEGEVNALVRSIVELDTKEVLFGGDRSAVGDELRLASSSNSIRIKFAAPSYLESELTSYRVYLEGFDEDRPWFSDVTQKDYTNLPAGKYRLYVESRNSKGVRSSPDTLAIIVEASLFQTAWAYALYLIFGCTLMYWALKAWTRGLNRRNHQLQSLVDERTSKLAAQANEIEERNEELERRNQDLRDLANKASEAAEAKSRFLAMMSHEIRTPMNGVMGMCALLECTGLNSEQREFLGSIKTSGSSLLNVIDDILDYTKFEEGRLELESITYDIVDCLESVVALLGHQAIGKKLDLYLEIDDDVIRWQTGDPTRLRQVFVNLIGNAIKFTEKGGVNIRLMGQETGDGKSELLFTVEDTGVGIEESKLNTIFDPFSQADVSNVRKFGGTGLGLTICRHISRCMGGSLRVESELGLGTTFSFSFPENSASHQGDLWRVDFERGLKVAAFTMDQGTRSVLSRYFDQWGVEAVYKDGVSLFLSEEIEYRNVDVVVIENTLRNFNAAELARKFLDLEGFVKPVPVVLIVSQVDEHVRACLDRYESLSAITKPLVPSRLLGAIHQSLELVSGSVK